MFEAGFSKGTGTRDQIANNPLDLRKPKRVPEKTSALLTTLNPLTVWITTNCGKFIKKWKYQTTLTATSETCMEIKKHVVRTIYGTMD